ncbi:hypothetical protein KCU83_g157, partial [Aureobasidium melanogenum]
MLRASSMVGMRPPIQRAQPATSSYDAQTGQSSASFRDTGPYTVRTALPLRKADDKSLSVCAPLARERVCQDAGRVSSLSLEGWDLDGTLRLLVVPSEEVLGTRVIVGVLKTNFHLLCRNIEPLVFNGALSCLNGQSLEIRHHCCRWGHCLLTLYKHPQCSRDSAIIGCLSRSIQFLHSDTYFRLEVKNLGRWRPRIWDFAELGSVGLPWVARKMQALRSLIGFSSSSSSGIISKVTTSQAAQSWFHSSSEGTG